METRYEIRIGNGRWLQVPVTVFEAWPGERRKDGCPYLGHVARIEEDAAYARYRREFPFHDPRD